MKKRKRWLILAFLAAMAGIAAWGVWRADRAVYHRAMADWCVVSGEVDTRWNWIERALVFHQRSEHAEFVTDVLMPIDYRVEFTSEPAIEIPSRQIRTHWISYARNAPFAPPKTPGRLAGIFDRLNQSVRNWLTSGSAKSPSPPASWRPPEIKGHSIRIDAESVLLGGGTIDLTSNVVSSLKSFEKNPGELCLYAGPHRKEGKVNGAIPLEFSVSRRFPGHTTKNGFVFRNGQLGFLYSHADGFGRIPDYTGGWLGLKNYPEVIDLHRAKPNRERTVDWESQFDLPFDTLETGDPGVAKRPGTL